MEFFHRPEDPANLQGYWGTRTSAVDWCEPNYTWSFYVAEFWNTVTSLPAAFLALYGAYLTYKYGYDKRFYLVNFLVGLVGIGSAAFHGTLLYTGQVLDEMPMVYASISFLYAVLEMEASTKPVHKYLAPGLIAFSLIFTSVYLYLPDFFIFFLVGYICAILTLVYQCSLICMRPTTLRHQKVLVAASVCSYIGGWLFFWVPEVAFCDKLQTFNFHAWWHVTSTFGAFFLVVFAVYQREIHRGRNPQLNYNSFMGMPLLPFVHIPTEIKKQPAVEVAKDDTQRRKKMDSSNEFAGAFSSVHSRLR
jgi:dihydroceramidase